MTNKQNLNEELSRIKEIMNINEQKNFNIGVKMAIFSHLSDLTHTSPEELNKQINFVKVLLNKFLPDNLEVGTHQLDDLWHEVNSGDFSGAALDQEPQDVEMGDNEHLDSERKTFNSMMGGSE